MGLPIVGPVNKTILEFVGSDFLFAGSVCVDWKKEYGSRKGTRIRNCLSSVAMMQFLWEQGCPWELDPFGCASDGDDDLVSDVEDD